MILAWHARSSMFARFSSEIMGKSGVTFTSQRFHLLSLLYFFVTGCQTKTLRLLIGVATVDDGVAGLYACGKLPSSLFIVVTTNLVSQLNCTSLDGLQNRKYRGNVGWCPPPWPPFNQRQATHGQQWVNFNGQHALQLQIGPGTHLSVLLYGPSHNVYGPCNVWRPWATYTLGQVRIYIPQFITYNMPYVGYHAGENRSKSSVELYRICQLMVSDRSCMYAMTIVFGCDCLRAQGCMCWVGWVCQFLLTNPVWG